MTTSSIKNRKTWSAAAVLVPILVLGTWAGYHTQLAAGGDEVLLAVEGYDPRDLLSGHYLQYRVKYSTDDPCKKHHLQKQNSCVCLEEGFPAFQSTWSGPCDSKPACRPYIKGKCRYGRFTAGIERYYIPEEYQNKLARIPPHATIRVKVSLEGRALVTDMFVEGIPILDWAKQQK